VKINENCCMKLLHILTTRCPSQRLRIIAENTTRISRDSSPNGRVAVHNTKLFQIFIVYQVGQPVFGIMKMMELAWFLGGSDKAKSNSPAE
jgi:hypothetical protein